MNKDDEWVGGGTVELLAWNTSGIPTGDLKVVLPEDISSLPIVDEYTILTFEPGHSVPRRTEFVIRSLPIS